MGSPRYELALRTRQTAVLTAVVYECMRIVCYLPLSVSIDGCIVELPFLQPNLLLGISQSLRPVPGGPAPQTARDSVRSGLSVRAPNLLHAP
jgi:hypothetical protein